MQIIVLFNKGRYENLMVYIDHSMRTNNYVVKLERKKKYLTFSSLFLFILKSFFLHKIMMYPSQE